MCLWRRLTWEKWLAAKAGGAGPAGEGGRFRERKKERDAERRRNQIEHTLLNTGDKVLKRGLSGNGYHQHFPADAMFKAKSIGFQPYLPADAQRMDTGIDGDQILLEWVHGGDILYGQMILSLL